MDPYMANVLVRLERDAMKASEARERMRKEQILRNALINESDDQEPPVECGNSQQGENLLSSLGKGLVSFMIG